ncbi:hypothetical protein MTO96_026749 [Rhipicephalus appendiculatus]
MARDLRRKEITLPEGRQLNLFVDGDAAHDRSTSVPAAQDPKNRRLYRSPVSRRLSHRESRKTSGMSERLQPVPLGRLE